jgi:hypothetical protein
MQSVSSATPNAIGSFSPLIDARAIDPKKSIVVVSGGLTPFDVFNLYVTLDPTWDPTALSPTPPNALRIGQVRGTDGSVVLPAKLQGFPFFALQRASGSSPGTFYASGPTNPSGAVAPGVAALPAIGGSALIRTPKDRFQGPVIIGLDVSQTVDDTFDVYGTDDPLATPISGSSYLGQIQGGGSLTGTTLLLSDYLLAIVVRTGGGTVGEALSYGAGDNGGQGTAIVADQTASGDITPQPPSTQTPQQLVDESFVIEVVQNTGGINLTLAPPSLASVASQRVVINRGAAPFTFYGKTVQPTSVSSGQDSAAIAVWTVSAWVLAGNS